MALKRTRVAFYGKRETRFTALATDAFKRGDREAAGQFHDAVATSITKRFERHLANGRRKPCNAGKSGHRNSRGY